MLTLDELKERKRQLGLTNEQVAKLSGVPLGTIQKVFGGTTSSPRRKTLEILSAALESNSFIDLHIGGSVAETEFAYNPGRPDKEQGGYTVKDYVETSSDRLVELIDGEMYDMCVPSLDHQNLVFEIAVQLRECINKKCDNRCKVFVSPTGVQLDSDDYTVLVPDLFVSCDKEKWHGKLYDGAPDFVVEVVSPSSAVRDRIIKLNKYWHAGCREYWIVDPDNKEVEIYLFEENKLGERKNFGEKIPVGISDGKCEIDLTE